MESSLKERYGGHALVTGAARGIGRAFATSLAADGFDLLLVDKEQPPLDALSATLSKEHGVDVVPIVCDLANAGLEDEVARWCGGREIGLLVNNAGISPLDPFLDIPLEAHLTTLDVNCRATLVLTHTIGRRMAARGRGGIIIVSSISGLTGSPYFCHYAATKGYGVNLAAGLWSELRGSGVDVLAVCPGMTDTAPVRERKLAEDLPPYVPIAAPEPVALAALRALGSGPTIVPTWPDRLSSSVLSKLMPRAWTLSVMKRSIERMRR